MNDLDKSPGTFGFGRIATAAITNNPPAGVSACGLFARFDTDRNYFVLSGAGEAIDGIVYGNHAAGETVNLIADGKQTVKLSGTVADGAYVQAGALGTAVTWDGTSPVGGKAIKGGVSGDVISIVVNTVSVGAIGLATARTDGNGGSQTSVVNSELITLDTGATFTDSVANLLPANSIIDAVTARVVTTITAGGTGWKLGDSVTTGRFTANDTTLTAGETKVGLLHMAGGISTDAAGPVQTAAAKVRITIAGAAPGAGAIRVTVYARTFVAPTA